MRDKRGTKLTTFGRIRYTVGRIKHSPSPSLPPLQGWYRKSGRGGIREGEWRAVSSKFRKLVVLFRKQPVVVTAGPESYVDFVEYGGRNQMLYSVGGGWSMIAEEKKWLRGVLFGWWRNMAEKMEISMVRKV
jgi:hypothetical protein